MYDLLPPLELPAAAASARLDFILPKKSRSGQAATTPPSANRYNGDNLDDTRTESPSPKPLNGGQPQPPGTESPSPKPVNGVQPQPAGTESPSPGPVNGVQPQQPGTDSPSPRPFNGAAPQPAGTESPSPTPLNGRSARGRFAAGNRGGPGNPFNRQIAAFRRAICAAVSEEDVRLIAETVRDKARGGDLAAVKILFQYVAGKPAAVVDPDRLDIQELQMYLQAPATPEAMTEMLARLPAELIRDIVRATLPVLANERSAQIIDRFEHDERKARRKQKRSAANL